MVRLLRGTAGNDEITGTDLDSNLFLDVGAGKDALIGGAKNDRFVMSVDFNVDQVDGRGGEDVVDYSGSAYRMNIDLSAGLASADFGFANAPGFHVAAQLRGIEDVVGSRFDDTITGSEGDNRIDGWFGNDIIHAGDGNDTLIGGVGINTLDGGRGTDTADYSTSPYSVLASLTTNQGAMFDTEAQVVRSQDTFVSIEDLTGSRNADMLVGNTGDNVIDGGAGNDLIAGAGGNDVLHGGDGDDQISSGATGAGATARMFGDNGNDLLNAGAGIDIVNGGSGTDRVSYAFQPANQPAGQWVSYVYTPGVTVDLAHHVGYGGWAEGDTYEGVENVTGSNFNDVILGDDGANVLAGLDGNDMIHGGGNDDTLAGGLGDDTLYGDAGNDTFVDFRGTNQFIGGEGTDTADYSSSGDGIVADLSGFFLSGVHDGQNVLSRDQYVSIENVIGSNQNDLIVGDGGDNVLTGNRGNDLLAGFGGNDTISGGDQNDVIEGGAGADTLDGGTGINTLSYAASVGGVVINLAVNTASSGDATGDVITNFQNVIGSHGNDVLIGTNGANVFLESAGNNVLVGGGGADTFVFADDLAGLTQVMDFHVGEDRLAFLGLDGMQDLSFAQTGSGTIVHIDGAAGAILLLGVNTQDLLSHASGEFVFDQTQSQLLQTSNPFDLLA